MQLEKKYRIPINTLQLRSVEVLHDNGHPMLILEQDSVGTQYLNCFVSFADRRVEQRALVAVSPERLAAVREGSLGLREAFARAENEMVYLESRGAEDGRRLLAHALPLAAFIEQNPIPETYRLSPKAPEGKGDSFAAQVLEAARQQGQVILGLDVRANQRQKAPTGWVPTHVLTPLTELCRLLLTPEVGASPEVSFLNLGELSLRFGLGIPLTTSLFEQAPEYPQLLPLLRLLRTQKPQTLREELQNLGGPALLRPYVRLVRAALSWSFSLDLVLANPVSGEVQQATFSPRVAQAAQGLLEEQFPEVSEEREYRAFLMGLDLSRKQPTFSLAPEGLDTEIMRGKVHPDCVPKLLAQPLRLGQALYRVSLRISYRPPTTVRKEQVRYELLDFEV